MRPAKDENRDDHQPGTPHDVTDEFARSTATSCSGANKTKEMNSADRAPSAANRRPRASRRSRTIRTSRVSQPVKILPTVPPWPSPAPVQGADGQIGRRASLTEAGRPVSSDPRLDRSRLRSDHQRLLGAKIAQFLL